MSEEQQLALALQMSMQGAGLEAMSGLLQSDGAEPEQEEQVPVYDTMCTLNTGGYFGVDTN